MARFVLVVLTALIGLTAGIALARDGEGGGDLAEDLARALLNLDGPVRVQHVAEGVPGWTVFSEGRVAGYVGSTWDIAESVGYSGRPLDVLVALSPDGVITGARLVRHNEPVLTLGISDADIARYIDGFAGHDLRHPDADDDLPDVISRATVSTGVIQDGILRTARTLAAARGLIDIGGGIDRLTWRAATWDDLIAEGALSQARIGMDDAARQLAGAKVPVPVGAGDFLHLWVGIVDPPTIGQNLLGQKEYNAALALLDTDEVGLIVMSSGVYSHRGTAWRNSGRFDRLTVVQGDTRLTPISDRYAMIRRLRIADAPEIREISLFALPPSFDPLAPFSVEVRASRPAKAGGDVATTLSVGYDLPSAFRNLPPAAPEPLWRAAWRDSRIEIAVMAAMLAALALILLAQDWITRRPRLWRVLRLSFLSVTLVILGWGIGGQLSVVQVVAFVHSLLAGFRWETFLIEPAIFMLWSFVALGLLFWGRGVYCGWLCPFGALQELTNAVARRLGLRQIEVPSALHERLWILKYTAFVGILALSFWSMRDALILAEIEPFKTAVSMRMIRAWPFVLFVAALLVAGLFIERFYCRYLCPLGAGLAIPAKLKIFDWLHRRPQCGRECRLCETKCTVGSIDRLGRINPNECILCLRCQVIMDDSTQCPVLKRRARSAKET